MKEKHSPSCSEKGRTDLSETNIGEKSSGQSCAFANVFIDFSKTRN